MSALSEDFPVARLGRLLMQNDKTVYRDVRNARYGSPFKVAGRLHVKVAAIERAVGRHFTYNELRAALAPPKVPTAPDPLDIQLESFLDQLLGLEAQHRGGELFTRAEVLAVVEHNLALRDIQWLALQKRQLNTQMPDGRAIIPDNETIKTELEELLA